MSKTLPTSPPTFVAPIVARESDLHRDAQSVRQRLKTLADIMRTHVHSTDMCDPVVRAHHALLRTRAIVCEALDHMEGEQ